MGGPPAFYQEAEGISHGGRRGGACAQEGLVCKRVHVDTSVLNDLYLYVLGEHTCSCLKYSGMIFKVYLKLVTKLSYKKWASAVREFGLFRFCNLIQFVT